MTNSINDGAIAGCSARRLTQGDQRIWRYPSYLQGKVQRELRSQDRLAKLSTGFTLVNDGWSILLTILQENIVGSDAECRSVARQRNLSSDLTMRYFRALEAERLIVLSHPNERECIAHVANRGFLQVIRYFLPDAAND